jgi:hypothetical protein
MVSWERKQVFLTLSLTAMVTYDIDVLKEYCSKINLRKSFFLGQLISSLFGMKVFLYSMMPLD